MSTLTIDTRDIAAVASIRPGDRVVEVDGHRIPRPRTVAASVAPVEAHGPLGVSLVNPTGSGVSWHLYPGNHDTVTVERDDEPAVVEPCKRREVTRRTVGGVTFVKTPGRTHGEGAWISPDGRYEVFLNEGFVTECENEHPVRIGRKMREYGRSLARLHWANLDDGQRRLVDAVQAGRKGYQCPGGCEHLYDAWAVWDNDRQDYVGATPAMSDSMLDAMKGAAEEYLRTRGA